MITGCCCCCGCGCGFFFLGAGGRLALLVMAAVEDVEMEELVEDEESGEAAPALCMLWEFLWALNNACRAPPAPAPGCRGDVGLMRVGSWPVGWPDGREGDLAGERV